MKLTFRWYGPSDAVTLAHIRQIPSVRGIVGALYDVAPGAVWPRDALERTRDAIEAAGLEFAVVESIPVHEDIKLGRPTRDALIDAWAQSLEHVASAGVPVVCYNFMPVFDWLRTDLAMPLPDGSTTLAYDHDNLAQADFAALRLALPGWMETHAPDQMERLRAAYETVDAERLWDHLGYFLERVVPVAEAVGVKLAIHPDDPPWSVFGLPRIITDGAALGRLCDLVDSPASGVCFCTGSLGADSANDLPAMARQLGQRGRIHFVHLRNVAVTGRQQFHEAAHPSGGLDLGAVVQALSDTGFDGPARPDHGRMIWGETGRPGYGLYDRALGAMYLHGLWEGIEQAKSVRV